MPNAQKSNAEALRKLGLGESAQAGTAAAAAMQETTTRRSAGWALHLKRVSEAATRELNVQVVSARLVEAYDSTDRDAALFELDSPRGPIRAILSRSGQYTFFWKR
jgi:hypothetical protein